jgi:hypothetical protein
MPHTELAHNGSGGGGVNGVDRTLGGPRMEAEESCKGREGGESRQDRHSGSLQEDVISVGQWSGQAHCGNLLRRPLKQKGKQERSERVALPYPTL